MRGACSRQGQLMLLSPLRKIAPSLRLIEGKPITTPDGLTCLACGQRAPSMEHMSAHFMTAAHTRAVKAYMAQ